ncbi:hypothetical protein [uncultured Hymenobacter sp.]|uniref:hypothetical protein n=1 Tax=uncultured Hymenobacter sp. TaxID=170016 RepID=UPI0035CAC662
MAEADYQQLMTAYLSRQTTVDEFITSFMAQWRQDRDHTEKVFEEGEQMSAVRFRRLMNRLFTSCDCSDKSPVGPFEITEEALRNEVALFAYICWG